MPTSPMRRTLKWCRDQGWIADVAEKWVSFGGTGGIRRDLFGFIDVAALTDRTGVLAIQVTSASNASPRVKKIVALPAATLWLERRNTIEVHGWRKRPNGRWHLNRWMVFTRGGKLCVERIDGD